MNIKPIWFIFLISLPAFVKAEEFNFKQPRDASILVNSNSLPWLVEVNFIAVNCFDSGKNILLNRSKADYYINLALSKKMVSEADQTLQIFEKVRTSESLNGERYHAKFKIPKQPVVVKSDKTPFFSADTTEKAIKSTSLKSDLLSRKEDILDTIKSLDKISRMQFPIAPNKSATDEETEAFFNSIVDFEENSEISYQALKKDIEGDRLLLSNERKDLLDILQKDQKNLLTDLSKHAQNH